jgi:pimeloyl-ACP methyl ester carboxylesterase
MSASSEPFHREQLPASRPIWREAFVGLDWLALHSSPVYYGWGVPRGDRSAVVVVPGFMGTDHYLYELYDWLRRIGYRPYLSGIGLNADCLDLLVDRLLQTMKKATAETGGKVHLIGHSLGGILSRSVAASEPESVASIATLGSPFRGIRSHPMVLQMAELVRQRIKRERNNVRPPECYTGFCHCGAVEALAAPFPAAVRQAAIYTRSDGIVDWRSCVSEVTKANYEVAGTHVGLAFNPTVYSILARHLANR